MLHIPPSTHIHTMAGLKMAIYPKVEGILHSRQELVCGNSQPCISASQVQQCLGRRRKAERERGGRGREVRGREEGEGGMRRMRGRGREEGGGVRRMRGKEWEIREEEA